MEPENFIKEGYVERSCDEKTQEEEVGLSPVGAIALGLLEILNDGGSKLSMPESERTSTDPEVLEHIGKKLVKDGYVEHRVDRETKEEQVCISAKGKNLLLALSYFVDEK